MVKYRVAWLVMNRKVHVLVICCNTLPHSDKATPSARKKWPDKRVASLEGDNLVVLYYLNKSEIQPCKRETTVIVTLASSLSWLASYKQPWIKKPCLKSVLIMFQFLTFSKVMYKFG